MNTKRIEAKIQSILTEAKIGDLMDYNLYSANGNDVADFYRLLIDEVLGTAAKVTGDEISDGKFRIIVYIGEYEYSIYSKANFGSQEIKEAIMAGLIYPYLQERRCS